MGRRHGRSYSLGVERAVTRWYLQRQIILQEIATLEAALLPAASQEHESATNNVKQAAEEKIQQLAAAQEKLRALGSCPRPMMG